MELSNDFRVSAPPEEAWKVLTDVERIAPLLPGAKLEEVEGDEYRGLVKVKVGPITAQYKGTASFLEQNQPEGRVVLKAAGRDTRGQGNANATITATLVPDGDGTRVTVVTDLTITGKVAQFGRGVLADVSGKLIGQFVDALEEDLKPTDSAAPERTSEPAPSEPSPEPVVAASETASEPEAPEEAHKIRKIDSPDPAPVDLVGAAGGSVAKRLIPALGVVGVLLVLLAIIRSRRR